MPGRLHHISLTVNSIECSTSFYSALGFTPEKSFKDDNCEIHLLYGESGSIELFKFSDSSINELSSKKPFLKQIGLTHFALEVLHLKDWHLKLSSQFKCSPITNARLGGFQYFFVRDPDGNYVELIEQR